MCDPPLVGPRAILLAWRRAFAGTGSGWTHETGFPGNRGVPQGCERQLSRPLPVPTCVALSTKIVPSRPARSSRW